MLASVFNELDLHDVAYTGRLRCFGHLPCTLLIHLYVIICSCHLL